MGTNLLEVSIGRGSGALKGSSAYAGLRFFATPFFRNISTDPGWFSCLMESAFHTNFSIMGP